MLKAALLAVAAIAVAAAYFEGLKQGRASERREQKSRRGHDRREDELQQTRRAGTSDVLVQGPVHYSRHRKQARCEPLGEAQWGATTTMTR